MYRKNPNHRWYKEHEIIEISSYRISDDFCSLQVIPNKTGDNHWESENTNKFKRFKIKMSDLKI